jgi:hypothetical protein
MALSYRVQAPTTSSGPEGWTFLVRPGRKLNQLARGNVGKAPNGTLGLHHLTDSR